MAFERALASAVALVLCGAIAGCGTGGDADKSAEIAPTAMPPQAGSAAEAPTIESSSDAAAAATSPPAPVQSVAKPAAAPLGDPIRKKGGLEEKCLARVEREVGAPVIGTNRIDESQASIDIYVNVQGAQAPWKCRGYRNGSIEGIEYTGDEGYL